MEITPRSWTRSFFTPFPRNSPLMPYPGPPMPVPFGSPHFPSALQTPLRHSVALAQGSLFFAPQRLSVALQTPDSQTRLPTAASHAPAEAGTGCPLGVFAVQSPVGAGAPAHHCVAKH